MVQVEVPTRWDDHTAALWALLDEPGTIAAALPGTADLAGDRVHLDLPSAPGVDLAWTRRHDEASSVHELDADILSVPIRVRLDGRGTTRPDLAADLSGLDAATGRQRRTWESQFARQLAHVLLDVDLAHPSKVAGDVASDVAGDRASAVPAVPQADAARPGLPRLPIAVAAGGLVALAAVVAVSRWWPQRPRPGD